MMSSVISRYPLPGLLKVKLLQDKDQKMYQDTSAGLVFVYCNSSLIFCQQLLNAKEQTVDQIKGKKKRFLKGIVGDQQWSLYEIKVLLCVVLQYNSLLMAGSLPCCL